VLRLIQDALHSPSAGARSGDFPAGLASQLGVATTGTGITVALSLSACPPASMLQVGDVRTVASRVALRGKPAARSRSDHPSICLDLAPPDRPSRPIRACNRLRCRSCCLSMRRAAVFSLASAPWTGIVGFPWNPMLPHSTFEVALFRPDEEPRAPSTDASRASALNGGARIKSAGPYVCHRGLVVPRREGIFAIL